MQIGTIINYYEPNKIGKNRAFSFIYTHCFCWVWVTIYVFGIDYNILYML